LVSPLKGHFMLSKRGLFVVSAALALVVNAAADQPMLPTPGANQGGLPVGLWTIRFANGVSEACVIRQDGTASVLEEKRKADGKAEVREEAVVIVFEDDRVERWTIVGQEMVVEHWFPAARFPAGPAVLGIGKFSR
jgi:hypothetical protein